MPAGRGAVPALVDDADLVSANAWLGTALNMQVALGPLLGGVLVASLGVRGALAADAASFVVSGVLLLGVPRLPPGEDREREPFRRELHAGLAFARRHRVARAVVVSLFLGVAFAGVDNVALVLPGARCARCRVLRIWRGGIGLRRRDAGSVGGPVRSDPAIVSPAPVHRRLGVDRGGHPAHRCCPRGMTRRSGAGDRRGRQRRRQRRVGHTAAAIGAPRDARPRVRAELHGGIRRRAGLCGRGAAARRHVTAGRLPHRGRGHDRGRYARRETPAENPIGRARGPAYGRRSDPEATRFSSRPRPRRSRRGRPGGTGEPAPRGCRPSGSARRDARRACRPSDPDAARRSRRRCARP